MRSIENCHLYLNGRQDFIPDICHGNFYMFALICFILQINFVTRFSPFVYCGRDSEWYTGFIILNLVLYMRLKSSPYYERTENILHIVHSVKTQKTSLLQTILEVLTVVSLVATTCSDPSGSAEIRPFWSILVHLFLKC